MPPTPLKFFAPRPVSSDGDEPTAVDGPSTVSLPLSQPLAIEPAALDRGDRQVDTPPSSSSKRARSDAEEGSVATPPKRPRYRVKTTPSLQESFCSLQVRVPEGFKEDIVSRKVWNGMTWKAQYDYAYERIRSFYVVYVHHASLRTAEERAVWGSKLGRDKQKEGRLAFKALAVEHRNICVRKWIDAIQPPAWLAQVVNDRMLTNLGAENGGKNIKPTQGVLLTWNLSNEGPSDSGQLAESLPSEQLTVDALVQRLRHEPTAMTLWGRVVDHGQICKQLSAADDVAVCMEVCPETYELQKALRLHIHLFLKSNGMPLRLKNMSRFEFEGCSTHVSTQIGGLSTTKGRSSWSGFFYCCIKEKRGTLFSEATKTPFTKFLVNPNWIMSLVQASKLPTSAAREFLVKCVNASRHVKELELHEQELEKKAVQEAMAEAERSLSQQIEKQKSYERVVIFLKQFQEPLHRYKFLVLAGPSKVGKTAFARSLCDAGQEVLEVNCASGDEPNLRAYRLRRHGLILFDEILAGQVAQQRKLFQAQSAPVQLGCSATNCHSYDVFVWRKKLVLASNNWHSSLSKLSVADQAWVNSNSIVLNVEEAMWEE